MATECIATGETGAVNRQNNVTIWQQNVLLQDRQAL